MSTYIVVAADWKSAELKTYVSLNFSLFPLRQLRPLTLHPIPCNHCDNCDNCDPFIRVLHQESDIIKIPGSKIDQV